MTWSVYVCSTYLAGSAGSIHTAKKDASASATRARASVRSVKLGGRRRVGPIMGSGGHTGRLWGYFQRPYIEWITYMYLFSYLTLIPSRSKLSLDVYRLAAARAAASDHDRARSTLPGCC